MIKKIDHLVITTAQADACLAFYEKLGFEIYDAGGRYELYAGDFKINVHILGRELLPKAKNVQPGSEDLCFEISGKLEEFKQKLEAQNIQMETDIVERSGVKGAMRSVYVRDIDGNLLEFCSYK